MNRILFIIALLLPIAVFAQPETVPDRLFFEEGWVEWEFMKNENDTVKKLYVDGAEDFKVEDLAQFPYLEGLILREVKLKNLEFTKYCPNLKILEVYSNYLYNLNGLQNLPQLVELGVCYNFVKDISAISQFPNLTYLKLYDNEITDIKSLANLKKLEYLDLGRNPIKSIEVLRDHKNLKVFSVFRCDQLQNLDVVDEFVHLTDLNISLTEIEHFTLKKIAGLEQLENLRIQGMVRNNEELHFLEHLTKLEQLTMGINDNVTDITALAPLKNLRYLDIHSNNISDISVLRTFPKLAKVVMYMNKVEDLSPLLQMPELRSLFIFDNPVRDYKPLLQLKRLQYLTISSEEFDAQQMRALRKSLPKTKISAL